MVGLREPEWRGLVVHVLTAGATFNLHTRLASSAALVQPRV